MTILYNKCGEEYQDCSPQGMVEPDQFLTGDKLNYDVRHRISEKTAQPK